MRWLLLSAAAIFLLGLTGAPARTAETGSGCSTAAMQTAAADAVESCSALLRRDDLDPPTRAAALLVRGSAYHRTRRLERAREDFDAALALAPQSDAAHAARGNLAMDLGDEPAAMRLLSQALKLNPGNAAAMRDVGVLHARTGDVELGLKNLSDALALAPGEPNTLYFRGRFYRGQQQYLLALQDADALVAMAPEIINKAGFVDPCGCLRDFHLRALKLRASILELTGKLAAAEADLNAGVSYKPVYDALEARGEFLLDHGRTAAGLSDFDGAVALEADHSWAWYERGEALARLARPLEAVGSYDRALALNPIYDYAWMMRARALRELGRTEEAVHDYEAALGLSRRARDFGMRPLRNAGYWRSPDTPGELTPALHDAVTACMLDRTCN